MDCGCVYLDNARSEATFFSSKEVIARKEYHCCECNEPIKAGHKYERVTGKWEGSFDTFRTCLDCVSIRNVFFCNGFEFGGLFYYLDSHIDDLNGAIASECLVKLTPKARQKVCAMIEQAWKGLDDND